MRNPAGTWACAAQAHLYLPAIFPDFYGKPIFGK
jgi:hypothetical protein